MLYVAVPADGNGVVRLAVPLRAVAEALGRIRLLVLTTALGALALALLLSLWFAGNLGGPLGVIGRAACRFSEGDFETQVRPRGPREIAALASSFNDMAIRLRTVVRELRAEKHKIETILERLGEAIVLANAAAARVFGAPTPQMLGLTTLEATQSHALDEAFRQALTTGETVTAEVRIRFPEGRTLEAVVAALTEAEPLGAVAILHDVTELRRLETVRREFVANASHELQTPITAIRALAETLHAGAKDDPAVADRFLADLERQADRLGTLVADLMDLAAVESGEGRLLPTPVRVADVARAVAAQLTSAAEQRGVSCELDISPELIVSADWSALRSILTNLLDNAVKYTERGGRTGIRADRRDGRIAITVWDTGIGIPSEDLPRIFERFYRVDKARSRELGGTGLGLAIVKHLAEALGGEIRVVSTLGQGSEFTVLLPAA
jgi:two-component system phosphate regulon sensor histidine kinase PhoR